MERRDEIADMDDLDQMIAIGLADAEAGRTKPMDEVFDRLRAKYETLAALHD
jgi:antitoxin ParD1/3/4